MDFGLKETSRGSRHSGIWALLSAVVVLVDFDNASVASNDLWRKELAAARPRKTPAVDVTAMTSSGRVTSSVTSPV